MHTSSRFNFAFSFFQCALIAFFIPGCVSFSFKDSDVKSKDSLVTPPGAEWAPVDSGTADVAFRNSGDSSTLSVNSVCDQYQSLSLEELSKTLTSGFDSLQEHSSGPAVVGGFPALSKVISAKLDGHPFKMAFAILRSKRCVYDISLIAKPENFEARMGDFNAFLVSFHEGNTH